MYSDAEIWGRVPLLDRKVNTEGRNRVKGE